MIGAAVLCVVVHVTQAGSLVARCGAAGEYDRRVVRLAGVGLPEDEPALRQRAVQRLADLCVGQQARMRIAAQVAGGVFPAHVECQGKDVGQELVQAAMARRTRAP